MQTDEDILDDVGFVPFSGGGQSLNGKQKATTPSAADSRTRSPSTTPVPSAYARSASPKAASPFGSVGGASPSPRQPSPFNTFAPVVAAPMAVPAGKLVFGKTSTTPSPSPSSSLTSSLNNARPQAPTPTGPTSMGPPPPVGGSSSGFVAFSGAGRSLK